MTARAAPTTRGGSAGELIGAGGEAEVYAVPGRPNLAEKRYRSPTKGHAEKLAVMLAHPPEAMLSQGGRPSTRSGTVTIAWPTEVVRGDGGKTVGFRMPRVDLRSSTPLFCAYNPERRRRHAPGFDWRYLMRTARNVATIVDVLHAAGYVIGDVNESNLLVSDRAIVALVDCDSLQVTDPDTGVVHRCRVGKAEFLAPEFQGADLAIVDRTAAGDDFALAILVFLLLMEGTHPYAGVWRGRGDPPDLSARMRARRFPYTRLSRVAPPPLGPSLRMLPRALRRLVRRTFVAGAALPAVRPSAAEWVRALEKAEAGLRTCARSAAHVYGGHLRRCPWCARMQRGLPDPFPVRDGPAVMLPPPSRLHRAWLSIRGAAVARAATLRLPASAVAGLAAAAVWGTVAPLPTAAALLLGPPLWFTVASAAPTDGRWWSPARAYRRARAVGQAARAAAPDLGWALAAVAGPVAVATVVGSPRLAGAVAAAGLAAAPVVPRCWTDARSRILRAVERRWVRRALWLAAAGSTGAAFAGW